jgi:hypothetical protein
VRDHTPEREIEVLVDSCSLQAFWFFYSVMKFP